MTALWHAEQERIEAGEQDVETFIADLMTYLQAEIEALDATGLNITAKDAVACPACEGGVLRKRNGKNGAFWGCSRYPECKATAPDAKGKPDLDARREPPQPSSEHRCEDCEKPLVRRPTKQDKTKFLVGLHRLPGMQTHLPRRGRQARALGRTRHRRVNILTLFLTRRSLMETNPLDSFTLEAINEQALQEKLDDMETPGAVIEFDPDEADQLGAFIEDALSEEDALEAASDKDWEVDHG